MVVATDLRDPTRDVVVESKDKVACGACGRRLRRPRCCGKRAFCTASVDAEGIARVFHSTGRIHRPARARRERRGCRGRDRARCSVRCRCRSRAHVVSFRVSTSNNEGTKQKWKRQTRKDEGRTKEGRRKDEGRTKEGRRKDEGRTKEGRRKDEGRTKEGRRKDEGRTKEGRRKEGRKEQTITSPTRISACRSPVPPTDRGRCRLAGIPLEALPPNIVIVVATQENVARPLPGEGTHDVAGVRLRWKRTGVEHWIGVVPSQAVETEGGGICRRQGTR